MRQIGNDIPWVNFKTTIPINEIENTDGVYCPIDLRHVLASERLHKWALKTYENKKTTIKDSDCWLVLNFHGAKTTNKLRIEGFIFNGHSGGSISSDKANEAISDLEEFIKTGISPRNFLTKEVVKKK